MGQSRRSRRAAGLILGLPGARRSSSGRRRRRLAVARGRCVALRRRRLAGRRVASSPSAGLDGPRALGAAAPCREKGRPPAQAPRASDRLQPIVAGREPQLVRLAARPEAERSRAFLDRAATAGRASSPTESASSAGSRPNWYDHAVTPAQPVVRGDRSPIELEHRDAQPAALERDLRSRGTAPAQVHRDACRSSGRGAARRGRRGCPLRGPLDLAEGELPLSQSAPQRRCPGGSSSCAR